MHLNIPNNAPQQRELAGTIRIGTHPEGRRDLCWISVRAGGQTLLRQIGAPGDAFDFGPATFARPAGECMWVFAIVHFPGQHGGSRTARVKVCWPDHCPPQGPCPPDYPEGSS